MRRFCLATTIVLLLPLIALARKDPSKYPLKVAILQQRWPSHNAYRGEYQATGRGNIWEGDSVHAFDFAYDCSFGLNRTARNQPYLAKWKKPQLRLAVLAGQIGKHGKYDECQLKTTLHDGVYILGAGGGINEMSQENYKVWKAKRNAAEAAQQKNVADPATISRVSVKSTPDSAEIEIDGEFAGNTPSTLQLGPGEHKISVSKAGYKTWEKKLRLAAGEINLNAELQPEVSQ